MPARRLIDKFALSLALLGLKSKNYEKKEALNLHTPDQSPFLGLPNELILMIASYISQESRVLLSLTCIQMRHLLTSLDLKFSDNNTKLRFLKCLENDYAELQTCLSCGIMYNWRHFPAFRCPRASWHPLKDKMISDIWLKQVDRYVVVSREVVNLVLRAHKHGEQYGLPLSQLKRQTIDYDGITRTHEARLVNGELILASRWEACADSKKDLVQKAEIFQFGLCLHWLDNLYNEQLRKAVEEAIAATSFWEYRKPSKCPRCATDYDLSLWTEGDGRTKIALNVWRNYGSYEQAMQIEEPTVNLSPVSDLDADMLSGRDLRALFEASASVHLRR